MNWKKEKKKNQSKKNPPSFLSLSKFFFRWFGVGAFLKISESFQHEKAASHETVLGLWITSRSGFSGVRQQMPAPPHYCNINISLTANSLMVS